MLLDWHLQYMIHHYMYSVLWVQPESARSLLVLAPLGSTSSIFTSLTVTV